MPDPVLHLLVGPNGAGKSTLYEAVIGPATHLEFVNADLIAAARWPDDPSDRSYEAATLAAAHRRELIGHRQSFVAETVFSHRSRLDLLRDAVAAGYLTALHAVMVPEELAVARVKNRVEAGGHPVPEDKVRNRFQRLWPLVAEAIGMVDTAFVYDNSRANRPFRVVARFVDGVLVHAPRWPPWTPGPLRIEGGRVR